MPEETATMSFGTRARLSGMMFLQYMLVAVWFMQLSAYLDAHLKMTGTQMAWILSSMALGCLASPLVGMFADRHFASERVLAVLNLLTGALLIGSGLVTAPLPVFIMLLVAMLCYMPTWGLTSAIAMSHSPSDKFPQIRVFGSIGWVAAGLFSLVAGLIWKTQGADGKMVPFQIDGTNIPLFCGAGVAFVAAIHAWFLPHTPPPAKGQKASVADALGLRSLSLMKDPQFAILIVGILIATIPFAAYWSYGSAFLKDQGFKYLTVTMNWGQFVEMFLMLLVPIVIAAIGLKWTIMVGVAALVVRYGAFSLGVHLGMDALYFAAIFVHGIIFGCLYVGAQIYVDRKAPKEMKAQAQGLMFLLSFGVGLLIGNFINGGLLQVGVVKDGPKNYSLMWIVSTVISAALLALLIVAFRDPVAAKVAAEAPAEEEASAEDLADEVSDEEAPE